MEFDPDRSKLIEAILEPLEPSDEVRRSLNGIVAEAAVEMSPQQIARTPEAAEKMRRSASSFQKRRRLSLLLMLVAIAWAIWAGVAGPKARSEIYRIHIASRIQQGNVFLSEMELVPAIPAPRLFFEDIFDEAFRLQRQRMPDHPEFFPLIPSKEENWREMRKERCDAAPGDPALFYAYASHEATRWNPDDDARGWSTEMVEIGESLDPGNGWFRFCRAASLAEKAVTRERKGYSITRRDKWEEALAELDRASSMPRLNDYRADLFRRFEGQWPQSGDLPDAIFSWVTFESQMAAETKFSYLRQGLRVWALEGAASGPEAVEDLDLRIRKWCSGWAKQEACYTAREAQRYLAQGGGSGMAGLSGSSAGKAIDFLRLTTEMRTLTPPIPGTPPYSWGSLALMVDTTRGYPAVIDEAAIRPGRLADYAMWERLLCHFAAALLGSVALACLLLPVVVRKRAGRLPERLTDLLNTRDRLLIAFLGLGIPTVVYILSTRSLPGAREDHLSATRFLAMSWQTLGWIVSTFFAVLLVMKGLLARRGVFAGRRGASGLALLMVTLLLAIPAAQWLPMIDPKTFIEPWIARLVLFGGLVGLPLLWLAWMVGASLFSSAEVRLRRVTLARACAPFFTIAALLAAVSTGLLHAEERRWVKQMEFESVHSPQNGFISPAHLEFAEKIRQALLKVEP